MKIHIEIELSADEILASLNDKEFEKFRTTIKKVANDFHSEKKAVELRPVKVAKSEKHAGILKKCIECGNEFHPKCNRQMKCDECRKIKPKKAAGNIDETLLEIEQAKANRESKPYEFGK